MARSPDPCNPAAGPAGETPREALRLPAADDGIFGVMFDAGKVAVVAEWLKDAFSGLKLYHTEDSTTIYRLDDGRELRQMPTTSVKVSISSGVSGVRAMDFRGSMCFGEADF
jgi:hypothetical protein